MASKQKSKSKKFGSTKSKAANSLSYSTTSSSKQYLDTSIDGQSSPASSSVRSKPHFYSQTLPLGAERSKENVTVTVRFRPLSPREIRQGEEIAWYADGETIVRNEHNPSIAYAYDRVFGPTTTTRNVYDVAAQHVVSGAMEGISGTIFAYGVTSSGKTHTMHGDQRSPGIIPLAVKDAFSIIQETPNREFLLRVSYLEIYNEVMNDLLNPAGQNLRIREDSQGIFVEGIKEEVVLSPAHALSLIAAGEEHRHVGSTNFNLLSSRSHTIFTLTIESSPCGENSQGEAVSLSQLNLIDLAGSESSKAETTGVRRKEGSYINKSLLTLGTVISKLTDGRAAHIPYRDSKLTRLLQSSLSGHGRVSLICTVTPSSSSSEETHNTLKFAHRAKHIEIQAAQNKIIDEKSLIKKYQNEIRSLKEELEQLRRGIVRVPQLKATAEEDLVLLKQKLEDGQVKLQSRLEQEEEAKAALLARIQRLTKLILVSSKASQSSRVLPHRPGHRRRYSFGEEELACLPHKRQDLILDNGNIELHEGNAETTNATLKEKKTRKHGLLNWLMPRKRESGLGTLTSTSDKSSEIKSMSTPSTPQGESSNLHTEARLSHSLLTESSPSAELLSEAREDREVHGDNFRGHETPLASIKSIDQIELLREQKKILSGEVALHSSALKRLSEVAKRNPQKDLIHVEMKNLKDEIMGKNEQIALLEKQITDSIVVASHKKIDNFELSHSVSELMAQLNEKSFELEVKAADNRVIQEQLNQKISECGGLQDTIASLKQQLSDALESSNLNTAITYSQRFTETESSHGEDGSGKGLLLGAQATAIEELKQKVGELTESKEQLELRNQKLAEESSYAKGLASAAAVELKALSEEVAKLMNHNERLAAELAASKNSPSQRRTSPAVRNGRRDSHVKRNDQGGPVSDIKRELAASRERELSYEAALLEKDQREAQLQRTVEESKQREAYLENELANMWVLVAKLKNSHGAETEASESTRQTPRVEGFGI
ncbi:kinesin-like protein KIN-7K, chloroplastic isoform X1 [Juglans microcarpa x Juglans regia]|uniref:kinesin-like protein KIN-7K, chloroplastic isoform X1 n=2 Tax=Juglans microcarpa x Juglans regia TaxID=2249226 RepID=UPI001B7DDFDE|nr:kinesin-like protein KIN-7K, chloroplastic isoform X1 [Juglans microcarpa x Juglans regia]XP_041027551.1 kinesin-like protein KIN-7K, chloroplastic isoform X1 [Juglans microcarpa x Juglans regia]XP_041027552.1 kinesin-like protein KIN-7K, chloroplastic isoform X1 [Juglans microcarpa x Juglans regia]XP_041027554.1 kinesin-like protein KIN-7K, chloroplastic isoform X1 [Juglans microcarpa x Juglans regia]XP_041027555.1 kinesin-like protein KIN-7K, chloroplastic isoform X1 [Juglans microcarpa x 